MPHQLYDYVDEKDVNAIKAWSQRLGRRERAKLNAKLDLLAAHGPDLPPNLLSGTKKGNIKKLKVHGNPQLRPMLCIGPLQGETAFTMLLGAEEKSSKLDPVNAVEIADTRRQAVMANPAARRCAHERVT